VKWKEFIRPTKSKLGIFGLICIIVFIFYTTLDYFGDFESSLNILLFSIHRFFVTIMLVFMWPFLISIFEDSLYKFFLQSYLEPNIFVPLVMLIPLVVYLYLISCFIKWVADKKDKMFTKNLLIVFGLIVAIAEVVVFTFVPYTPVKPYTPHVLPINQTLGYRQFKARCDALCQNFINSGSNIDAAKFCVEKLTGDTDLNRNGKDDAFQTSAGMPYVCEDSLYCFHVTTCSGDNATIGLSNCKDVLCNYYSSVYQNSFLADQKLRNFFNYGANGAGACDPPGTNWYLSFFYEKACPRVGETTYSSSSSALLACVELNKSSFNCRWTCPNILSSQNPGVLSSDMTFETLQLTQSSGNHTFTGFTFGKNYNFGLVCDLPQAQITKSYSIKIF
jgi:hypothetical protein